MSHALFFLTDTNPNDTMGGGGCLCSPSKDPDTKGPYVVIPSNDMDSVHSPHVVVCASCYSRLKGLFEGGEVMAIGEKSAVTQPDPVLPRPQREVRPIELAPDLSDPEI